MSLGDLICIAVERLEGLGIHGSLEGMGSEEIWVDPPDYGPDELLGVGHCCGFGGRGLGGGFGVWGRFLQGVCGSRPAVDSDACVFIWVLIICRSS